MRTLRVVAPESDTGNFKCRLRHHPTIHSLARSLLAGISVWSILPTVLLLLNPKQPDLAGYGALMTGVFVLPATLLVLWPTDRLMPRSSRFWHPGWIAALGLISGILFLAGEWAAFILAVCWMGAFGSFAWLAVAVTE